METSWAGVTNFIDSRRALQSAPSHVPCTRSQHAGSDSFSLCDSVLVPEEGFLLGCVFAIADYPEQMSDKQLLATWKRVRSLRYTHLRAHTHTHTHTHVYLCLYSHWVGQEGCWFFSGKTALIALN